MIILPTIVLLIYIQYFHALPIGGNRIETNQKCFIPMLINNFKALTLTSVKSINAYYYDIAEYRLTTHVFKILTLSTHLMRIVTNNYYLFSFKCDWYLYHWLLIQNANT